MVHSKVSMVAAAAILLVASARAQETNDPSTPRGHVRASELIGAEVEDSRGDSHGKLIELFLAPTHDAVLYAVVRCEADEDKDYLVPPEAIRIERDGDDDCVLRVEPDALRAMSSYRRDDFGDAQRIASREHANTSGTYEYRRASEVLGRMVVDSSGEELGSLDDLLIQNSTGSIPFAIVAMGGVLGIGENKHVVPPTAITETSRKNGKARLRIDSTKGMLAAAPTCDKNGCPDPSDAAFVTRMNEFYGIESGAQPVALLHTSDLVDCNVRMRNTTHDIGKVRDVTFAPADGRLAFVVVEIDDLDGVSDRTVALPWQLVRFDAPTGALMLDTSASRLGNDACVVANGVADLDSATTRDRLTSHFGSQHSATMTEGQSSIRGKDLLTRDVNDRTGADVGEVEDVAFDLGSGKLRYVAVLLDRGDRLVALQWNELRLARDAKSPLTMLVDEPTAALERRSARDSMHDGRKDG